MNNRSLERNVYPGLPAFNEELAIAPLFDRIRAARLDLIESGQSSDLKVIFYDDGSTDNTASEVRAQSHGLDVFLLSPGQNGGLGVALRGLFAQFLDQGQFRDVFVVMDADDTHDPNQIRELLIKMDAVGMDVVIASRYRKGSKTMGVPAYRQGLSLGFAGLVKVMLPIKGVRDYSCGFRSYSYAALSTINTKSGFPIEETGFASMPEILIRLRSHPFKFGEIPLQLSYNRRLTISKMRSWENSKRLLSRMWKWRVSPAGGGTPLAGPAEQNWWTIERLDGSS